MKKTIEETLSSNMQDYLEAIGELKKRNGIARVRDIGRLMNVKTPSVTGALNALSKDGLVTHERYGYVELTQEGEKIADNVRQKHDKIIKFLTAVLGIDLKIASQDACRMEHSISENTFQKLAKFIEFIEKFSAEKRPEWLKNFDYFAKTGKLRRLC